jgi:UDP-N-acetylmuramate--alanine ligase
MNPTPSNPKHIYFIGIGGISVSALAQVALAQGTRVSGSDRRVDLDQNPALARLQRSGAELFEGHDAANLAEDVDLVVTSAAIPEDNPEARAARSRGVPVVSRAELLGTLMAAHKGVKIGVAGTHGKTTTTAMIGVLLQNAGLAPTVFVGGEAAQIGGNVCVGSDTGPFVAEACEAYDSFLSLHPDIAVLTNVEADHLDHYGTVTRMLESFRRFVSGLARPDAVLVACLDDPGCCELIDSLDDPPRVAGYGIESASALSRARAVNLTRGAEFTWRSPEGAIDINLRVPGRHNVLNALAAATVARELGVAREVIATELAGFQGVGRRQEVLGEVVIDNRGSVIVMDDYAHHPTEIRATIAAMRAAHPDRRLVVAFQPHLYSRTRDFMDEFALALSAADVLIVTDIYAAREAPIPGVSAADIVSRAAGLRTGGPTPALFLSEKTDLPATLAALAAPGDLVLVLGAGDLREQGEILVRQLRERRRTAR